LSRDHCTTDPRAAACQVKIQKLEQLVRLKDSKIATLQAKLQQAEPR
jgi:hypothetical protein